MALRPLLKIMTHHAGAMFPSTLSTSLARSSATRSRSWRGPATPSSDARLVNLPSPCCAGRWVVGANKRKAPKDAVDAASPEARAGFQWKRGFLS